MKIFDLAFYEGVGDLPAEVYESQFNQVVGSATTKNIYPYRQYNIANEYYSIDTTDNYLLFFGKKILNNNVVFGDTAYITPFIGARYKFENNGISLIVSLPVTNVAGKNTFSQVTYPELFLDTNLPDPAGNNLPPAINALRIRGDTTVPGTGSPAYYYGAFPCVIFRAELTGDTASNVWEASDATAPGIVVTDFDIVNPLTITTDFYYFITDQKAYRTGAGIVTPTPIKLPPNFVNLTAIASYRGSDPSYQDFVTVAGFDSDANEYRIAYINVFTGGIREYKTVGNGGNFPINRIYYSPGENTEPEYFAISTANGAFIISIISLDIRDTVTNSTDKNVTDLWAYYEGTDWIYAYATTAGFYMANNVVGPATFKTIEPNKSFNSITSQTNDFNSAYAGGNDYLYYAREAQTPNVINKLVDDSDKVWNDLLSFNVLGADFFVAGATQDEGVVELEQLDVDTSNTDRILDILFFDYVITLADIIKEDINIYYGLLEITGCGAADGGAALFKLDFDKNLFEVGTYEGNITTNKLWITANFFVLNNTQDLNSMYYKSLLNLDLSELTGTQEELVGEDAGIFNTTEAGDVVDIIIDRSMFYILGTRAIEIWQNNGATGFPYRKQPYSTAKYHNFPKGISSSTDFISRFTPFGDGYLIATINNSENMLDILMMKDGAAKVMPYNKSAWLQVVNQYVGSTIDDIQINTFKLYGDQYIGILLLDDSLLTLGTLIINKSGKVFFLDEALPSYQYVSTVAQSGVIVLFDPTEITSRFYDYIHTSLSSTGTFDYVMTSKLLRSFSSHINISKIVIEYAYAVDDSTTIPAGTSQYKIEYSEDGRSFQLLGFAQDFNANNRQIVIPINRTMASFALRFSSTIEIIILKSMLIYDEVGLTA